MDAWKSAFSLVSRRRSSFSEFPFSVSISPARICGIRACTETLTYNEEHTTKGLVLCVELLRRQPSLELEFLPNFPKSDALRIGKAACAYALNLLVIHLQLFNFLLGVCQSSSQAPDFVLLLDLVEALPQLVKFAVCEFFLSFQF